MGSSTRHSFNKNKKRRKRWILKQIRGIFSH